MFFSYLGDVFSLPFVKLGCCRFKNPDSTIFLLTRLLPYPRFCDQPLTTPTDFWLPMCEIVWDFSNWTQLSTIALIFVCLDELLLQLFVLCSLLSKKFFLIFYKPTYTNGDVVLIFFGVARVGLKVESIQRIIFG